MIFLTKLDKSRVLVAVESIKFIESAPDTLVRFVNGDMLIVLETQDEIREMVTEFKARCLNHARVSIEMPSISEIHAASAN